MSDEKAAAVVAESNTPAATEETPAVTAADASSTDSAAPPSSEAALERERSEKILKAKELYSHGSRNFLVKSYAEAADELSQVCALYGELHGELSDELGMPYLLYAKSLIALALDENKVIDVPDEEEDDEEEEEEAEAAATNGDKPEENGTKLETIKEDAAAADSTEKVEEKPTEEPTEKSEEKADKSEEKAEDKTEEKMEVDKPAEATAAESEVSSTDEKKDKEEESKITNGATTNGTAIVNDGEKPSTSNGDTGEDAVDEDEENEAASNLQLAWEILELAAKIFSRQGEAGRSNLAEVHTELGNIEFENNVLDSAREDYEKALTIYKELPANYRRAMAEIHYKIGLSYLMQQSNKEGAASLKEACKLIEGEIEEIKAKPDLTDKDKNNIQDMEETKQEIEAKIVEIEETQAQNIAEVRAALDSYIKPMSSGDADAGTSKTAAAAGAATDGATSTSGSAAAITSSSKPTDISHLIKRKKPEESTSEAEAAVACSPAKRPAV
ncbi:nuclear autoantigenic sperm protein [Musca autumnalis]|uniref:nuclear autoantigenic sperm protein n=1 Tax=Musca autumnalis TaxID=221902 RepID=UPI003CE7B3A4